MPKSLDRDASNRTFDRQLAYLGLLKDAAPLFRDGSSIPGAGVQLALPCLVESGLFQISRKLYGEIGPAFYGLRTTLLTLLLMALLRIKRPEHLKEKDPAAFGRLLGLDRAPEVKTLRRRLTCLAARNCAEQLGSELARVRVDRRGHLMGFLYVDGHVRASGLLDRDGTLLSPHKWTERQYKSDVSTERVKRFRQQERNGRETPPEQNRKNRTEAETVALIEVTDERALAAWDDYGRKNTGKPYPRNKRGTWHHPTKFPPGHEAEVHAITTGRTA